MTAEETETESKSAIKLLVVALHLCVVTTLLQIQGDCCESNQAVAYLCGSTGKSLILVKVLWKALTVQRAMNCTANSTVLGQDIYVTDPALCHQSTHLNKTERCGLDNVIVIVCTGIIISVIPFCYSPCTKSSHPKS